MTKGKKNGVLEMLTELENKMETHPTVYGFQKDLKEIIKEYKPGDKVKLIVIRNSHFITIDYELSEIDFKEYLKFYDKSIKERFNEGGRLTAPPEKEEKKEGLIPPPKRLLVPDSEDPGLPDNEKRNGDKNGTNG